MKKLLSTALIAVMLSSTIVDTASAAIQRRVVRSGRQAPRRTIRRRRNLPRAQGKTSPEQLRKTAQQAERDAKKLQDDAKKSQTGKTTEQTVVADAKKVEANIGKIEQQLANLRTWSGDVLPGGYSLEEKNKAFDIAAPFIKESEALKQRIKANQQKIDLITTKRYFGLGSPIVNKGKEEEYARYSKLIEADKTRLAKLEPIIAQQEVIMGKRRSNAIKGAYGVMAAAAIAVGADLYTGGALSGAAATQLSSIASNIAYYTPSPISSVAGKVYGMGAAGAARLKAGWDYLTGNVTVEDLAKGAAESLTKEKKQSWTNTFGKEIADTAYALFGMVARAGGTIALEEGAKIAYLEAAQTLGNPKATPADAEKAINRLKSLMDKAERAKEKAEREAIEAEKKAKEKAYQAEREARERAYQEARINKLKQ